MPCTTILVGRAASCDGSTVIARNDDAGSFHYTAKKVQIIPARKEPATYKSVLSHAEIPLPGDALAHTAAPNALEGEGIWAASGINEANVSMTATETITSNPRVLGADPLVKSGIGEEDLVMLVLPYIRSAREGVERLGTLLVTTMFKEFQIGRATAIAVTMFVLVLATSAVVMRVFRRERVED